MDRPPPIRIDDEIIRRDIDSDDILTVHPKLPKSDSWRDYEENVKKRTKYMQDLDIAAYKSIASKYPELRPPWYSKEKSWRRRISKLWYPMMNKKTNDN